MDSISPATLLQGLHDLNLSRHVSGAGITLLIYDHALTFADEVELVWKARLSLAKILFLLNRYAVLLGQLNIAVVTNNYYTSSLSNATCKGAFTAAIIVSLISGACANVLILLRVLNLWEFNRRVSIAMGLAFFACYSTGLTCLIFTIVQSFEYFQYVPFIRSCAGVVDVSKLRIVWAAEVAFELFVLVSVILNALSRPRKVDTPLERLLVRDGILVFGAFSSLQAVNLIVCFAERASLRTMFIFPVWSLTTLILNRSLLRMQKESSLSMHMHLRDRSDDSSTQALVHSESYPSDFGPLPFPEEQLGRLLVIEPAPLGTSSQTAGNCKTRTTRTLAPFPSEAAYAERVIANKRTHAHRAPESA